MSCETKLQASVSYSLHHVFKSYPGAAFASKPQMNVENAEDEAGEKEEALAAARLENKRLRAMLSSASSGETAGGVSVSEVLA